jgi:hypothetical protein
VTEKNSKERARLHTANLARIAAVKGAPRETHNMTIKRYECFTGHEATNYDATETDDGPWVSYTDHAEAMQKLWQTADTRERMNSQTIATLRAERDEARGSLEKSREYTKLAMGERDEAREDTARLDWIAIGAEAYQQRGFYLRNDGLWAVVGDINDFGKAASLRESIDAAREEQDDG